MNKLLERIDDKFGAFGSMLVLSMGVLFSTIAVGVVIMVVIEFAPYLLLIIPASEAWMVWSVWRE